MKNTIKRILRSPKRIMGYIINKTRFGKISFSTRINSPLRIDGAENIYIDERVIINYKAWLASKPLTGFASKLIIKSGSVIGDFAHIYATHNITIEEDVLIANFVYISDNIHSYTDIKLPIIKQSIQQKHIVNIGAGSWIGEHVCIIGASIGKHCIIGANSVITKDIPDYCVVVGSPAKIIKRFDFINNSWRKTNPDGNFI